MDDRELLELAAKAGFTEKQLAAITYESGPYDITKPCHGLTKFAALVAAAERERCAKVCDERYAECLEPEAKELAAAIRAMND